MGVVAPGEKKLQFSVLVAGTQSCLLGLDNFLIRTVQHLDIIKVFYSPTNAHVIV